MATGLAIITAQETDSLTAVQEAFYKTTMLQYRKDDCLFRILHRVVWQKFTDVSAVFTASINRTIIAHDYDNITEESNFDTRRKNLALPCACSVQSKHLRLIPFRCIFNIVLLLILKTKILKNFLYLCHIECAVRKSL